MSIQFKLVANADPSVVEAIMNTLRENGTKAVPLFPNPKRASLAGIFTMALDGKNELERISIALKDFSHAIEYIEAGVTRAPK